MPPLTPAQTGRATAWATVFADGQATTVVLDDMVSYARQLPDPLERAGATGLILYLLMRRSELRRQKRPEGSRG